MTIESFWPYGVGPGPLDELLAGFLRELSSDSARFARSLTEDAVDLLRLAIRQAGQWGNPEVDTEHLLWAASQVDDSRRLLEHAGFTPSLVARSVEGTGRHPELPRTEQLAFATAAKRTLLDARRISWASGGRFVGPAHIVLALADRAYQDYDPDDAAGHVLRGTALTRQLPSRCGRDLTRLAGQGLLHQVVGRDDELTRLTTALRGSTTPVLVGGSGVGKTAVLEGLSQLIVDGAVPEVLGDSRMLHVERWSDVREIDGPDHHVIVGIDELAPLDELLEQTGPDQPMRAIVSTTPDAYDELLDENRSVQGKLAPITVDELDVSETEQILLGLRDQYAAHHRVRYDDSAVTASVQLSKRYLSDRSLPGKAIDLLDLVGAYCGTRTKVVPHSVAGLKRGLAESGRNGHDDVPTITGEHVADVVAQLAAADTAEIRGEA